jgi:hypothetical protein
MATRRIDGVLREVWTSDAPLNGGDNEIVPTDISVSTRQLDRVQGFLIVTAAAGTPALLAVPSVGANGRLVVTVFNGAAPGNTASWRLDVTVNQSTQQATTGATGSLWTILVLNPVLGGGPAVPQTLDDTYDVGIASANQTMTLTDAHGGGIIIDATDAGLTVPGAAFEVRASTTIATPTLLSRYGDDAVSAALQIAKARGTFGVPADAQTGDSCGTVNFTARVNGAFYDGSYIEGVCEAVGGPTLRTSLNFYITAPAAPNVRFRALQIYAWGSNIGETIVFGATSNVRPNGNDEGYLGTTAHIWNTAYLGNALLYHASDDAVSSVLQFSKSRGTLAIPANTQTTDQLGTISFYGYSGGTVEGARIASEVMSMAGGIGASLDFYTKLNVGAVTRSLRIDTIAGPFHRVTLTDPGQIIPGGWPNTSQIGTDVFTWNAGYFNNVRVGVGGGIDIVGGVTGTLLFNNTSTMPVPQANQVYLGSKDFGGFGGTNLAVLEISAEEPPIVYGEEAVNRLIPIRYNGVPYYLHATDVTPP